MDPIYLIEYVLLVLGFGTAAALALTARKRSPRSAMLATTGFAVMAAGFLIMAVLDMVLRAVDAAGELFHYMFPVLEILFYLTAAALLVMAVLNKENTQDRAQPAGTQPPVHQWQQPGQQPHGQQPPNADPQWGQPGQQPPPGPPPPGPPPPGQQPPQGPPPPGQQPPPPGQQFPGY